MASKRIYVGTGILTVIALFTTLQLYGLQIKDITGDVYCTDTCVSYFDVVNPTSNSVYIYNKNGITLDFSPKIKDYSLYTLYRNKWVKIDFNELKLPNVPNAAVYSFVFPRYSTKHFKLVGTKETWQTVKWGFGIPGKPVYLDPTWKAGQNVSGKIVSEVCKIEKVIAETKEMIEKVCKKPVYQVCLSGEVGCSLNNSDGKMYKIVQANAKCWEESIKKEIVEICHKTGGMNISGYVFSFNDFKCGINKEKIDCDSIHDGNGNGNCNSGESCYLINVSTLKVEKK